MICETLASPDRSVEPRLRSVAGLDARMLSAGWALTLRPGYAHLCPGHARLLADHRHVHRRHRRLRAKEICRALGNGTDARHVEGMRSKLKKLVARGILDEPEAGLLDLAAKPDARRATT